MNLLRKLFGRQPEKVDVSAVAKSLNGNRDPLDLMNRNNDNGGWEVVEEEKPLRSVSDFTAVFKNIEHPGGVIEGRAADSANLAAPVCGTTIGQDPQTAYDVPPALAAWYNSQGFIGYQRCAILAQQWLVDKACSQSVEDSVRNGWTVKPDSGQVLSKEQKAKIDDIDIEMKVKFNLMEFGRFANIFGIRVMIYVVESDDKDYYTKPFNPDGIALGSYKGMSQVDPYWMTPALDNESMSNPASIGFYEPDYWIINGVRYHKSHLEIARGPQPADILKPTYIFGGISLVQRIYERVYAAERTANEAPLLAMNKRTTAIHVDLDKVAANEASFVERLMLWVRYRDNHGVKVLGKEETMEQFDTSLSDFDAVIMNQFQIVAATAKTPATKLLGTSPKGFNATGEFETVSYHEELESIQERWMTPVLNKHYICVQRSLGLDFGLNVTWEPVDTMSSEKQADINSKKVADAVAMITAGMISPDEGREKIAQDRDSGWNNLSLEDNASEEMGESPLNIAANTKADAAKERAAQPIQSGSRGSLNSDGNLEDEAEDDEDGGAGPLDPNYMKALGALKRRLESFVDSREVPTTDTSAKDGVQKNRKVKPNTKPIERQVVGVAEHVGPMDEADLPKMRIGGMTAVIENPRNSIRSGNGVTGPWKIKMPHHYGYIKGSKGADGDEIDVFIGPNPKSPRVFVVNQNDASTGEFDEHKVLLGFNSPRAAKQGYMQSYGKGWKGFGNMVEISMNEFRDWCKSSAEEIPLDGPYQATHNTDGPVQG